jgi:hypothetical protein
MGAIPPNICHVKQAFTLTTIAEYSQLVQEQLGKKAQVLAVRKGYKAKGVSADTPFA